MALWKSGKEAVRYDASEASERKSAAYDGSAARDSRPEPCDHSAAIWPKNTMAIRPHAPKPYDTNLMKSTMSKKFATVIWMQKQTPVRPTSQNRYDATSVKTMTSKKFATPNAKPHPGNGQ